MGHSTKTTAPRRVMVGRPAKRILLRVVHSPDAALLDAHFDLTPPKSSWIFGRNGPVPIRDDRLSRQHCEVQNSSGTVKLEDLGSTNGCLVQGRRLDRGFLAPNGVLRIGDTLLVLDEEPADDQLTPPNLIDARVPELIGPAFATESVRRWIASAAHSGGTVLLVGPTGSGKDLAARALHRLSGRPGPFITVSCGAIAPEVADLELFGRVAGAFPGADESRAGLLAQAQSGTLFLDHVGDLIEPLQVKLLRFLEERVVRSVGEAAPRAIDARVVAATARPPASAGLRPELLARLSEWEIDLEPLASRRADILPLARHFLRRFDPDRARDGWTAEFAEALLLHDWPLNARELDNLLHRCASQCDRGEPFDVHLLPVAMTRLIEGRDAANVATDTPPRTALEAALTAAGGNVARVAEQFGRDRAQVYRWLRRHNLDPATFRG